MSISKLSKLKLLALVLLVAMILPMLPVSAFAEVQPETGSISGTVMGQTEGGPVPLAGVDVYAYPVDENWNYSDPESTVSDENGDYDFVDIPAGDYVIHFVPRSGEHLNAYLVGDPVAGSRYLSEQNVIALAANDELINQDIILEAAHAFSAPQLDFVSNPINSDNETSVEVIGTSEPWSTVIVFLMGENTGEASSTVQAGESGQFTAGIDVSGLADGNIIAVAYAIDDAWNYSSESNELTTIKNTISPSISTTVTPESPDGANEWYKTTPVVELSADNGEDVHYSIGNSEFQQYTNPISIPDGENTLNYYAENAVGNRTEASLNFKVDTTAPTSAATTPDSDASNIEIDSDITITFSEAMQPGAGYDGIKLENSLGEPIEVSKTIAGDSLTISPANDLSYETTYTVTIPAGAVEDVAGNTLQEDYSFSFKTEDQPVLIDIVPPITTVSPASDDWFNTKPMITLTANETATIYYKWGEGAESVYSAEIEAPEGTNTLYFYAVDSTGNTETVNSQVFKVDTIAPAVPTIDTAAIEGNAFAFIAGTIDIGTTVHIKVSDGTNEANHTQFVPFVTYSAILDVTNLNDGDVTVTAYSVDLAGNISDVSLASIHKDTQGPEVVLTTDPAEANGKNGWFTSDAMITLTANEAATIYYFWDDNSAEPAEYNERFAALDGAHELTYYAVDSAGNTGATVTTPIKVDKTAPDAPVISAADTVTSNNASGAEVSGQVEPGAKVFLTITDGTNAATDTAIGSLDGIFRAWPNLSGLNDGTLTITAYAEDDAGHTSGDSASYDVLKETLSPIVESTDPSNDAADIALDKTITITFSEDIEEAPAYGAISLTRGEQVVEAALSIEGSVLTISPVSDLALNTTYSLVIPASAAKDKLGNELKEAYTTSFKTVSVGSISGKVKANDEEAEGPAPLSGITVSVYPVGDQGPDFSNPSAQTATDLDGNYIMDNLAPGRYLIEYLPGAESDYLGAFYPGVRYLPLAGIVVVDKQVVAFDDVVLDPLSAFEAPEIKFVTNPVNAANAGSVVVTGTAEAFSTVHLSLFDGNEDNDPVSDEVQADESGYFSAVLNISELEDGLIMVAAYSEDDLLNESGETTFAVNKDTKAPVVDGIDVGANRQRVVISKTIGVIFDEGIQAGPRFDGANGIRILRGTTVVPAVLGRGGDVVTIDPVNNLAYNTEYTIVVPSECVKDMVGNMFQFRDSEDRDINYEFTFKTEPAPTVTPQPNPTNPTDTLAPASPRNVKVHSNRNMIHLTWSANTEADLYGYNIYRKEKGAASFTKLNTGRITNANYQDSTVEAGKAYIYYITAIDRTGNESAKSSELEASIVVIKAERVFSDVPSGAWFRSFVAKLTTRDIIGGYADGLFKPHAHVTRAEFAKMLCLAMNWQLQNPSSASFNDVNSASWAYRYIETARANGVIDGYVDGGFRPNDFVTREEIAKIMASALKLPSGSSSLTDIGSSWAKDSIDACAKAGIVSGYTDRSFKPKNRLTRAEAAKIIASMIKD